MAGEGDEHVVERRPVEHDVVDSDARRVERADGVGDHAVARNDRRVDDGALGGRAVEAHLRQRGDRRVGVGGLVDRDVEAGAADLGLQLVAGALGDHLAVIDHHDLVAQPVGLVEVLGGEQHGAAGRRAGLDRLPHADPAAGVEPGGGLVQEQHGRPGDERGGEVEPAPHAAGVGLGRPLGGVDELEPLEQLVGALLRRRLPEVVEPPDHLEILEPGQVLVDGRVLAREADLGPQRGGVALHIEPGDPGRSRIGLEQGGEDPHRGGLAGAVGAQQAEHTARAHGEIDAVEGPNRAVRLLEPLDNDRIIGHAAKLGQHLRPFSTVWHTVARWKASGARARS